MDRFRLFQRWMRRTGFTVLVTGVSLLGLWELGVQRFGLSRFILPPPTVVFQALGKGLWGFGRGSLNYHLGITLSEVMAGFLAGSLAGLSLAVAMVVWPALRRVLYPYLVAFQSVPRMALAPLFVIWFGFGISSKIVLTMITVFFPVFTNSLQGLSVIERDFRLLLASWQATPWQELWLVRFPGALPGIFAGLKVGAVFSVVAAVIGEFMGTKAGIGAVILQAQFSMDVATVFAALALLAVVGSLLTAAVTAVERRALFWQGLESQAHDTTEEEA